MTSNKDGTDENVKIYGQAIDEQDEVREAFQEAIRTRMDWAEGECRCFSVDVSGARYVRVRR